MAAQEYFDVSLITHSLVPLTGNYFVSFCFKDFTSVRRDEIIFEVDRGRTKCEQIIAVKLIS